MPRRWTAQRPGGISVLLRWLRLPREAKTEVVGCQGRLGGHLPLFTPLSHSTEVACMVLPQEKSTEPAFRVTAELHWRSRGPSSLTLNILEGWSLGPPPRTTLGPPPGLRTSGGRELEKEGATCSPDDGETGFGFFFLSRGDGPLVFCLGGYDLRQSWILGSHTQTG